MRDVKRNRRQEAKRQTCKRREVSNKIYDSNSEIIEPSKSKFKESNSTAVGSKSTKPTCPLTESMVVVYRSAVCQSSRASSSSCVFACEYPIMLKGTTVLKLICAYGRGHAISYHRNNQKCKRCRMMLRALGERKKLSQFASA